MRGSGREVVVLVLVLLDRMLREWSTPTQRAQRAKSSSPSHLLPLPCCLQGGGAAVPPRPTTRAPPKPGALRKMAAEIEEVVSKPRRVPRTVSSSPALFWVVGLEGCLLG